METLLGFVVAFGFVFGIFSLVTAPRRGFIILGAAFLGVVLLGALSAPPAEVRAQREAEAAAETARRQGEAAAKAQAAILAAEAAAAEAEAREAEAEKAAQLRHAAAMAKEAACREDLQCWAKRFGGFALRACDGPIEDLAQYDYEWVDRPSFSRVRWAEDSKSGKLVYFGDSIKFLNAFGAWLPHTYMCVFDTDSGTVAEVVAAPGRL